MERTRRRQRPRLLPTQQAPQELPTPPTIVSKTGAQESQLTLPRGDKSGSSTIRRSGAVTSSPQPTGSTESRGQKVKATAASGFGSLLQAPANIGRITPLTIDPPGGARTAIWPTRSGRPSGGPSHSEFRRLRLGIETEFYLAAYNRDLVKADFTGFTHALVNLYNIQVPPEHPRMHAYDWMPEFPEDHTEWGIDFEETNRRPNSPCELIILSDLEGKKC